MKREKTTEETLRLGFTSRGRMRIDFRLNKKVQEREENRGMNEEMKMKQLRRKQILVSGEQGEEE